MYATIKTEQQAGVHVPEDKWTLWEGNLPAIPDVGEVLMISGQPTTYVKTRTWSIHTDRTLHVILWVPIALPVPTGRIFYNDPSL